MIEVKEGSFFKFSSRDSHWPLPSVKIGLMSPLHKLSADRVILTEPWHRQTSCASWLQFFLDFEVFPSVVLNPRGDNFIALKLFVGMLNVHAYALFWLCALFISVVSRRFLLLRWLIARSSSRFGYLYRFDWLRQRTVKYFPRNCVFNAFFLFGTLISNVVALIFNIPLSFFDGMVSRIGGIIAINFIVLSLLSCRHSLFTELAAAYQPEFLWAHHVLGYVTVVEIAVHFVGVFQGQFLFTPINAWAYTIQTSNTTGLSYL